jgi:large subunit ribosomal protein L24
MSMQKIKKDDVVIMLAGRDKGRSGRVIKVVDGKTKYKNSQANTERLAKRVIVEGLNLVKKHTKPNPQKNEQGGIISKEASVSLSNVALMNPRTQKADRVGFKVLEDGTKVRYFKSDKENVDI